MTIKYDEKSKVGILTYKEPQFSVVITVYGKSKKELEEIAEEFKKVWSV